MPRSSSAWRLPLACVLVLALAGCSAYHRALRDAEQSLQSGHWEEAVRNYERALVSDPRGQEARAGLEKARRAWALELVGMGDAARKAGKLEEAADAYARAARVDENNPEAPRRLSETLDARVQEGEAALKATNLVGAMAHFEAVLRREERHAGARMGKDRVHAAWARRFYAQGEAYEKQGKLANALVEYVRADEERAGATPARERAEVMRQRLRDEVAFWVEMQPVVDRASSPDVALRLSAGRLAAVLPQGLPLQVVTGMPSGGPGVRLKVAIERVWALKDKQVSQRTKKYIAGMRAVPNPERAQGEKSLLSLQRDSEEQEAALTEQVRHFMRTSAEATLALEELERCRARARRSCEEAFAECSRRALSRQEEAKVADACRSEQCEVGCQKEQQLVDARRADGERLRQRLELAQGSLDKQRRQMQRTRDAVLQLPLTVEEPLEAEYVYDVEKHRLEVRALVTTQLEELFGSPTPPAPVTREALVVHEDTAHAGADRFGILADPLELMSELELRDALGEKAVEEVAAVVMGRYALYRDERVDAARRGLVRAGADDMVEVTVRALLLSANEPPADLLQTLAAARKVKEPLLLIREKK